MPILQIQHEDGRVFNVAEQAYEDLYKPFGFEPVFVVFAGANHAYTPEALEEAKLYEKQGFDPNQTYLTVEASAREALAKSLNEDATKAEREAAASQAESLIATSKALRNDAISKTGFTTNPPPNDTLLGAVDEFTPKEKTGKAPKVEDVPPVTDPSTATETAAKGKGKE